jgi:hypothetical protein
MAFDLHQLDNLKEIDDKAISALETYADALIDQFRQSPEGLDWLNSGQIEPDFVGSWVDNLLYFGLAYLGVTLPQMTDKAVKTILTELFVQKVSLQNPDEADTVIPELMAFWQFLKREYKLSQANRVLKILQKIQPQFKTLMTDSSHFGVAKLFVQSGLAAGFDMTDPESIAAFKDQFNQSVREGTVTLNLPSPAIPSPPETALEMLSELSTLLNADEGDEGEIQDALTQMVRARLALGGRDEDEVAAPLLPEIIATLQQQTITEVEPGSILRDFQTFLESLGDRSIPVSGARHNLPLALLREINAQLTTPIEIAFQRPGQKSYPNVSGLYLLARATGLVGIGYQKNKPALNVNTERLEEWQQLNPTERYFTLLEVWLVRARPELLGEPSPGRFHADEGSRCLSFWELSKANALKFATYAEQSRLNYYPNFYNLALMELFGFVTIQSGKPEKGKGWRIKRIEKQPWGNAIFASFQKLILEHDFTWPVDTDPWAPMGDLQPFFQQYFSDWQRTLTVARPAFRPGVHVFKVSLDTTIWRRIAIAGELYLCDLSSLILKSVKFDDDHLHLFQYQTPTGIIAEVNHPYAEEEPSTDEVRVGDVPLEIGASMLYVFDFGDCWEFQVTLEAVEEPPQKANYAKILERHGTAPRQYPD